MSLDGQQPARETNIAAALDPTQEPWSNARLS